MDACAGDLQNLEAQEEELDKATFKRRRAAIEDAWRRSASQVRLPCWLVSKDVSNVFCYKVSLIKWQTRPIEQWLSGCMIAIC